MKAVRIIALILVLLLLVQCGGGSEGTGNVNTKTLSGNVRMSDGEPLVDAEVTVQETGDSTTTDSVGSFLLQTETDASILNLLIEKGALRASTTLSGLDEFTSNVKVDLTLLQNGDESLVTVGYLEVWARIVGECEKYFENEAIIRQKRKVPDDLRCTLRFFASGDGQRLERIRGRIDVRSCDSNEWRPIANGTTGSGANAGLGDIDFDFIDNKRNCVYRLIAPLNDEKGRSFELLILTRTFQRQSLN